jgi:hypothetical protein
MSPPLIGDRHSNIAMAPYQTSSRSFQNLLMSSEIFNPAFIKKLGITPFALSHSQYLICANHESRRAPMHSLFILPIATYMMLAAWLIWNSPNRNIEEQGIAEGGGRQDTMV